MQFTDLIKTYDNALSPDLVTALLDIFTCNHSLHIEQDNPVAKFTEMNLNLACKRVNPELLSEVVERQRIIVDEYTSDLGAHLQLPTRFGFEEFRIKRYDRNGKFDWHVDVSDHNSARRYVSFLYYLTDVQDDSGLTRFFGCDGLTIKPKAGMVLVFPPLWMYPHQGELVTSEKFIMSSYLHYL